MLNYRSSPTQNGDSNCLKGGVDFYTISHLVGTERERARERERERQTHLLEPPHPYP